MEEKIFEKLKKQEIESSKHYFKIFGIEDGEDIIETVPAKNFDFETILLNLNLIKRNPENIEKINKFHDYLFKMGIELGVFDGKQTLIDSIKNGKVDFEKIESINPEKFVPQNIIPTFISDLLEEISNEN